MAKMVSVEWKYFDEMSVVGIFESDMDGYRAREQKEYELKDEGHDDEDVCVWIEDIDIVRDEVITNKDVEYVISALCGVPTISNTDFADKIKRILNKFVK